VQFPQELPGLVHQALQKGCDYQDDDVTYYHLMAKLDPDVRPADERIYYNVMAYFMVLGERKREEVSSHLDKLIASRNQFGGINIEVPVEKLKEKLN